jgi:hypothetical protein
MSAPLAHVHRHDERFTYNPPAVPRPAMDEDQFWYDEQRDIEVALLANPAHLAHAFMRQRDELKLLREELDELRASMRREKDDRSHVRHVR